MTFSANSSVFIDSNRRLTANTFGTMSANSYIEVVETLGGTVSGYTTGGSYPGVNIIDKFPFSTDSNSSDVGDLTTVGYYVTGQSSTISGYTSGGARAPLSNIVDKFPFATDINAVDVGDLTQPRKETTGQSSPSNGYTSGGYITTPVIPFTAGNTIDKFPFAADANATDVGDLTQARLGSSGQSSLTNGYTSGGFIPPSPAPGGGFLNTIDKFPFAINANATDVGDLPYINYGSTGQSSSVSGYVSGGQSPSQVPVMMSSIHKFPFATETNITTIGDLTVVRDSSAGQSSIFSGYTSGGNNNTIPTRYNIIEKFPFATDANATDVGDLTLARRSAAGQQY